MSPRGPAYCDQVSYGDEEGSDVPLDRLGVAEQGVSPTTALDVERLEKLRDLWLETVVLDFLDPITANVLLPLDKEGLEHLLDAVMRAFDLGRLSDGTHYGNEFESSEASPAWRST